MAESEKPSRAGGILNGTNVMLGIAASAIAIVAGVLALREQARSKPPEPTSAAGQPSIRIEAPSSAPSGAPTLPALPPKPPIPFPPPPGGDGTGK